MELFDDLRYSTAHDVTQHGPTLVIDPIACCTPVRTDALDEVQADTLARSFAALAAPIRLRLLSFITSSAVEVCACDLVEPAGRSQPTVSHHMKILVDARLVEGDKRGPWAWYRAVRSRLDAPRRDQPRCATTSDRSRR